MWGCVILFCSDKNLCSCVKQRQIFVPVVGVFLYRSITIKSMKTIWKKIHFESSLCYSFVSFLIHRWSKSFPRNTQNVMVFLFPAGCLFSCSQNPDFTLTQRTFLYCFRTLSALGNQWFYGQAESWLVGVKSSPINDHQSSTRHSAWPRCFIFLLLAFSWTTLHSLHTK